MPEWRAEVAAELEPAQLEAAVADRRGFLSSWGLTKAN
jgi:hypothetical protein